MCKFRIKNLLLLSIIPGIIYGCSENAKAENKYDGRIEITEVDVESFSPGIQCYYVSDTYDDSDDGYLIIQPRESSSIMTNISVIDFNKNNMKGTVEE